MLGSGLFRGSSRLRELADEELMTLMASGEPDAFAVIFDRHSAAGLSLAFRMCGQRGLAEEIVQEAFLSVWRSAGQFDESRGSVRSFVLRIVRNRAIDTFRTRTAREGLNVPDEGMAERMASGEELTDVMVLRDEEARHVRTALEGLPSEQRQVIELAYFAGLTHVEIAERLSLPAGTVKGRMRLGLEKLRSALAEPVESVV